MEPAINGGIAMSSPVDNIPANRITNKEIEERVMRIVRHAGYLARNLPGDHILEQMAHEAILTLVGPTALHANAAYRSQPKKDWALDLLAETLRAAKLS